jgi:squalene synthase HpnC
MSFDVMADRVQMDPSDTARDDARAVLAHIAGQAAGQAGAENFPVALRVLPARPRQHLARVYAYARFVDDVGDRAPGDRLALLDAVDADVQALDGGTASLAPVAALAPVVAECGVPLECFRDLIEANRVDQHVARYETFEDLLGYCRLSAAPVGRIVLHIAGAATTRNIADSDAVCNGLQVLEHCQDVGEDARAGRVYLPATDLRSLEVGETDLLAPWTSPPLRRAVAVQVERAESLLGAGRPLVRRLRGWARVAVAGYVGGGLATATALRDAHYDVLQRHVGPSKLTTAVKAVRLMAGWWR